MKKALLVLLLLAVAAGGLFAQVSFSGSVISGLEVVIPDEGDIKLYQYHQDGARYRFQLSASYTNADGTAGAGATIRNTNGAFAHDGANAWVKPLDILTLRIGTSGPGGFGSLGAMDVSNDAATGFGLSALLVPTSTFSLGASVIPGNGVKFDDARYNFGAKVTAPDLLTAVANLMYNGAANDGDGQVNVAAGVGVTALNAASGESGLTRLAVDVQANNITQDLDWIGIGPAIGFRVANVAAGNLTGTLRSRIWLPLNDNNELDFVVGADASVPIVTGVTFRLGAAFESKATGLKAASTNENYAGAIDYRDWDTLNQGIGGTDPLLAIRPSLTFNIGGGTIETGWSFQTFLADTAKTQQAIYAIFGVSF